ncbi:MAG: hypothetical protein NZ889_01290 [Candidatus Pacearchaeota archaeon]|nr:hypothetical protein [Candidatus Pacearchaeota archaeon]
MVKRTRKKKETKVMKKAMEKVAKKESKEQVAAIRWVGVTGSIIILLAGILWLFGFLLDWQLEAFTWFSFGDYGIINIICGLVILITSVTLKKNFLAGGFVLLIFSIIALIAPPAGFVVGPVLGIIAAILALVRAKR